MKIIVLYQLEKIFNKKIKKPIINFFKNKKIEDELKQYKYIHIMTNGIHSACIINFLNKYFSTKEHCFIFVLLRDTTKNNIQYLKNIYCTQLENVPLNKVNKIIVHGLFSQQLIKFLFEHKYVMSKTYWFIWGGDLYLKSDNSESSWVKQNFAGVLTSFDYEVYKNKFGPNRLFDVTYPHDINEQMITNDQKQSKNKKIRRILINNCADITSIEMYEIMAKFKDEDIEIYSILSYVSANQKDCRLQIMKKGFEIFGNKYHPILDFMKKNQYANFLSTIDIYISNQDRQQGNGNSTFICSLGGKVFTKSDTSVYKKYNSIGIRYFDTYSIKHLSFQDFIKYDDREREQTVKNIKHRMSDLTKIKQWSDFFDSV